MTDRDVEIWCTLGKSMFVLIPLVIFLGSTLRGSVDQIGSGDQGSVFSGHPQSNSRFGSDARIFTPPKHVNKFHATKTKDLVGFH